jgi:exopolysaccharide production protein ExoY
MDRQAASDAKFYTPYTLNSPLGVGGLYKRIIDLSAASLMVVAMLPILLVVAAAIKLCDGGPVFFKHRRVGLGGRTFDCLKFRTMKIDAEARLADWLKENPAAAEEWNATRKLKNDPRLTPIGKSLRKSSIDELPQLFNVLRGEMSLVGPRPVVAEELLLYGRHVAHYYAVRPGLTGAWQISGRNDVSYAERVRLDTEYCMTWSATTDLLILFKTVPVLFSGRGSY